MDGLFLFFFAIFGCSSVTALLQVTLRAFDGTRVRSARRAAISFWHQLDFSIGQFSRFFFSGRVRETARDVQASFLERLERGVFRAGSEVQHSAILSATKRGTGIGPANTGSLTRLVCFAPVDFSRSSSLGLPVRRSFSRRVRAVCSFASTAVAPRTPPTRRSHRRAPHGRRRGAEAAAKAPKPPPRHRSHSGENNTSFADRGGVTRPSKEEQTPPKWAATAPKNQL